MSKDVVNIGFLPLVDAALPILARELGFAEDENVAINMVRDVSWASVLDRLLYGHSDVAHMLAPLSIAATLGRGRPPNPLAVPFVLGLNGNAITLSNELADKVSPSAGLGDPYKVGHATKMEAEQRKKAGNKMRLAVVHRYSSHNYKLRYWLAACGIDPDHDIDIVVIAPPYASDALAAGEVDGICVGEPWNSVAVEQGNGRIVLITAQIWRRGVEKVLAMKNNYLSENQPVMERLIRALHRTGAHFIDPANWDTNAAILSRPEFLDGSKGLIKRAISDRMLFAHGASLQDVPDFMFQHREAAAFPWKSQAAWLYSQMVRWENMDYSEKDQNKAENVFRPDVYRTALRQKNIPIPAADSKVEGEIVGSADVKVADGDLIMSADGFFDGRSFNPDNVRGYISLEQGKNAV